MLNDITTEAEDGMKKAVEAFKRELAKVRTGRASPAMLDGVRVDYYGTPTPVNQLASFQTPEARMILINVYDKGSLAAVEKAIRDSDLGVNPTSDGSVIRVVLPQLTEERRKEYIKLARHKAEETRVAVRNTRRHANDSINKLVKDKEIGEDDARGAEKQLDGVTRKYVDIIDELLKAKEAELLEV